MSGKLVVHLEGERRLLQELLKVLSAALVLEPVDVVAIGGDLQTSGRRWTSVANLINILFVQLCTPSWYSSNLIGRQRTLYFLRLSWTFDLMYNRLYESRVVIYLGNFLVTTYNSRIDSQTYLESWFGCMCQVGELPRQYFTFYKHNIFKSYPDPNVNLWLLKSFNIWRTIMLILTYAVKQLRPYSIH